MRCCTLLVIALLVGSTAQARAEDPLYSCKQLAPGAKISAQFAPDISILDLVTWVSGFTCKTVILDSEVKARVPRVTIVAPASMTAKQAMQLFVDAVEITGLVVQQKKDTILIKLGPKMPRSCPAVADATPPTMPVAPPEPSAVSQHDEELEKLLDTGIKKLDETHIQVSRQLIDAVLANPMAVAKGARVVPAVKDGKPNGFKLYAIRPTSLYAKLGLMNGDTLRRVNGQELATADKALEVYTQVREAKSLVVDIERRGKPITLTYTVK
jgi:hypothetical protein